MALDFTLIGNPTPGVSSTDAKAFMSSDGFTFGLASVNQNVLRVWKHDGATISNKSISPGLASPVCGALSPDGLELFAAPAAATWYLWTYNAELNRFENRQTFSPTVTGAAACMDVSNDGLLFAIAIGNIVYFYRKIDGVWTQTTSLDTSANGSATTLRWAHDSRTIAINTGGDKCYLRYYNTTTDTLSGTYVQTNAYGGRYGGKWTKDDKFFICVRPSTAPQGSGITQFIKTGTITAPSFQVFVDGGTNSGLTFAPSQGIRDIANGHKGKSLITGPLSVAGTVAYTKDEGTNNHWTQDTTLNGWTNDDVLGIAEDAAKVYLFHIPYQGTLRLYKMGNDQLVSGNVRGLLPQASGELEYRLLASADMQGILPTAAGDVDVPFRASGDPVGLLPAMSGSAAVIDDPGPKYTAEWNVIPAIITTLPQTAAFGSAAPDPFAYAKFRGFLPGASGEVTVPQGFGGDLTGLLPRAAGSAELRPKANGDLVGLLPQMAADVFIPEGDIGGHFLGILPVAAGEIEVQPGGAARLVGLLPAAAGSLKITFYAEGAFAGRLPTAAGSVAVPFVLEGAWQGIMPRFNGWGAKDYSGDGEWVGLLPVAAGEAVRAPDIDLSADLVGLLPRAAVDVYTPNGVEGRWRGLKPTTEGYAELKFAVSGTLRGLKPKAAGEITRAYRIDANVRGLIAKASGSIIIVPRFRGAILGLLPRTQGDVKLRYPVNGDLVGRLPSAAGEFKTFYAVRADLNGLLPVVSGEYKPRYLVDGVWTARLPVVAAETKSRYLINGGLVGRLPRVTATTEEPIISEAGLAPTLDPGGSGLTLGGGAHFSFGGIIRIG